MLKVRVIDSHTGGEPTRVVLPAGVPLVGPDMAARKEDFRARFDHLRSGIVNEPRGSEVLVGAALTEPVTPNAVAGVVFFNEVGYLGMCGHGTIGVVETLRYLGQVKPGEVILDTPVGTVTAFLSEDGEVSLRNVRSYRYQANLCFLLDGIGSVIGDVAYGGNWFFIVRQPTFDISLQRVEDLTATCWAIRRELTALGIKGKDGEEIDHVELFSAGTPSRNFVQCPGGAYDRSPCGTGTSAKLACLYANGTLTEGEWYTQASVTGSSFRGKVEAVEGGVIPTITGRAFVTAESTLLFDDADPIRWGLNQQMGVGQ